MEHVDEELNLENLESRLEMEAVSATAQSLLPIISHCLE